MHQRPVAVHVARSVHQHDRRSAPRRPRQQQRTGERDVSAAELGGPFVVEGHARRLSLGARFAPPQGGGRASGSVDEPDAGSFREGGKEAGADHEIAVPGGVHGSDVAGVVARHQVRDSER
jgi:hypothetical protein